MKICRLLLLVILLLPQAVSAISLDEMQKAALDNRALVKRSVTEIEKSVENIRIARSGYFPSLDFGYQAYTVDEPAPNEQRENSIVTGALSWNIFTGFSDKYSIKSAEALEAVEKLKLRTVEQNVQLLVALRYLAVYNQRARLKVAEDRNETLKGLYLDSKNRYDVGLIDRNAVLKFKVDYDNADLTVKKEQADLEKTVYELNREVGIPINYNDLEFREFQEPPKLGQQSEFERTMLSQRSELKVLEGLVESAEYLVSAEYGDYYPDLDVVGRYSSSDNSLLNRQGEFTDEQLRAELVLTYNLFTGFSDEAEIARAKANVRTLKYDLKELQNDLTTELKKLFVDFEISLANVEVAREDIAYAEENLRITELKYKEGIQRQLDLLDAVSNLTRAQSNYVAVVRSVFENYFRIIRMVEDFPHETSIALPTED
jgi:outer membrane protein TolC